MLTEGDDLVCQPIGGVPQAPSMARTVRAIASRSAASAISAWPSQRQPWAESSCPRARAISREPRVALDGPPRGAEGGLDPVAIEQVGDAPVAGPGPVLEVGGHAEVGNSLDDLRDLVDGLVPLVAVADEELRAFLHVDDERDGEARPVRPLRIGRLAAITLEVALHVHPMTASGA